MRHHERLLVQLVKGEGAQGISVQRTNEDVTAINMPTPNFSLVEMWQYRLRCTGHGSRNALLPRSVVD
eukprot:10801918-Alexandrium_andersonii.AAC.1